MFEFDTNPLFTDDPVFPCQLERGVARSGEFLLAHAVLDDAIASFKKYRLRTDTRSRRLTWELREWFTDPDDRYTFAFRAICQTLGIDAAAIQRQVLTQTMPLTSLSPRSHSHNGPLRMSSARPRKRRTHTQQQRLSA